MPPHRRWSKALHGADPLRGLQFENGQRHTCRTLMAATLNVFHLDKQSKPVIASKDLVEARSDIAALDEQSM